MELRDLQRLTKIKEYCEDIDAAVARYGNSFETFQNDRDFQHSVAFCILQIGEMVGGLSETYRNATKDCIEWHKIKSMRNIVAHAYGGINLEIVWDVATGNIPDLEQFCAGEISDAKLWEE